MKNKRLNADESVINKLLISNQPQNLLIPDSHGYSLPVRQRSTSSQINSPLLSGIRNIFSPRQTFMNSEFLLSGQKTVSTQKDQQILHLMSTSDWNINGSGQRNNSSSRPTTANSFGLSTRLTSSIVQRWGQVEQVKELDEKRAEKDNIDVIGNNSQIKIRSSSEADKSSNKKKLQQEKVNNSFHEGIEDNMRVQYSRRDLQKLYDLKQRFNNQPLIGGVKVPYVLQTRSGIEAKSSQHSSHGPIQLSLSQLNTSAQIRALSITHRYSSIPTKKFSKWNNLATQIPLSEQLLNNLNEFDYSKDVLNYKTPGFIEVPPVTLSNRLSLKSQSIGKYLQTPSSNQNSQRSNIVTVFSPQKPKNTIQLKKPLKAAQQNPTDKLDKDLMKRIVEKVEKLLSEKDEAIIEKSDKSGNSQIQEEATIPELNFRQHLKEILEINENRSSQDSAFAAFIKGIGRMRKLKDKSAISAFKQALNFDKLHFASIYNLACLYERNGRIKTAELWLDIAVIFKKKQQEVNFGFALIYYKLQRYEEGFKQDIF